MMKYNILYILMLVPYFVGAQVTTERTVLASGGGSYSSTDLMVDHTIGELMVSAQSSGGLSISQGFHQYFEAPNAVPEHPLVKDFKLYPNPVSDDMVITFSAQERSQWKIQVVNPLGKVMTASDMLLTAEESKKVTFNCRNYPQGVYFVRLQSEKAGQEFSYKFVKIK